MYAVRLVAVSAVMAAVKTVDTQNTIVTLLWLVPPASFDQISDLCRLEHRLY